nr:MAG TPA: tail protein [Caudoviricetes sp.]
MREYNKAMFGKNRTLGIKVGNYTSGDINDASFNYGFNAGDTYTTGSTIVGTSKISFSSIITTFNKLDKLYPEIGILVGDAMDWTKMGEYYIDDIEIDRNSNTTTLMMMDGMYKFNQPYVTDLTFPATVKDVVTEMCVKLDVALQNPDISVDALRYTINAKPKKDKITFREVLSSAIQLIGMSAFFNREGKLEIRGLEESNITINAESYYLHGLKKSEIEYQIAGMTCKAEKATYTVGLRTGRSLEIQNDFMTQAYLDDLYFNLKNIRYYPYTLEFQGHLKLNVGQWVTIVTNKNETYKVPIFSLSYDFKGGLSSKISADTRAGNDAQYSYTGSLTKKIEQASMEIEDRVQAQLEQADREFNEKVEKIRKDAEEKSKDYQAELKEKLNEIFESSKDAFSEKLKQEFEQRLTSRDSEIEKKLNAISFVELEKLKREIEETAESARINAELIGGDGGKRYNKNRLDGAFNRTIELGRDYIEVGHNGDGFEVGKEYTISWSAECTPYGHRNVTLNVPSVLFTEGGHVILRPTDTRFPSIEHDINSSNRVVPMVYYGDYNIEFSGNWYRPKVTIKTVSATIEELSLDFEYKAIIDSNGDNRTETVWSENPQIIIDGGNG